MKCLYCGNEFTPYKFGDGRQKFCSQLHQYRDWAKKHPDRIKQISQKSKRKHRQQNKEYNAKWYTNNKEKSRMRLLGWRRRNKAKAVQQVLKRYYKSKNSGGTHTLEEWEELKEKFNYRCAKCGETRKLTRDHIIPLSKDGRSDIQNIQPLCRPCNSRKFNHLEEQ